jgi:hypothetical protein
MVSPSGVRRNGRLWAVVTVDLSHEVAARWRGEPKRVWVPMPGGKPDTPWAAGAFSPVDGGFVLEQVARVVGLWCDTCNKHVVLVDDGPERIEQAKAGHVHGSRTSLWGLVG